MPPFIHSALLALATLAASLATPAAETPVDLETRIVELSDTVKVGDRVGRLRFLGMLALPDITRNGVRLSQLSGLAWDDDDGILYAISDKGGLFHLQPKFTGDHLVGLRLLKTLPLRPLGQAPARADSEGLNILRGRNRRQGDAELLVSFERFPRIVRYRADGTAIGEYPLLAPLNDTKNYRDANMMLESVCVDPSLGVITAPEAPLKSERDGYTRLFSLAGKSWLYPFTPGDRITDMECLGNGEVVVLQQTYLHAFGQIKVQLKRVQLTTVSSGQTLQPESLALLDSKERLQIDNFEGLTRHKARRFFMVSDNNDLFVQRTLLLYFELLNDR
jgi:hypothetical protein